MTVRVGGVQPTCRRVRSSDTRSRRLQAPSFRWQDTVETANFHSEYIFRQATVAPFANGQVYRLFSVRVFPMAGRAATSDSVPACFR